MKPDLNAILLMYNISRYQYLVLQGIFYYSCNRKDFVNRILAEPRSGRIASYAIDASKEKFEDSIEQLMNRGLIGVIDNPALEHVIDHLSNFPGAVVFYGMPTVGYIDMTIRGGQVWESIQKSRAITLQSFSYTEYFDFYVNHVFCSNSKTTTDTQLKSFLEETDCTSFFLKDGPRLIRNWRRKWWNSLVPKGYTFCIQCKYKQQSD